MEFMIVLFVFMLAVILVLFGIAGILAWVWHKIGKALSRLGEINN